MRKCRLKSCRAELPKAKDCQDGYQKAGFCNVDCMAQHGLEKARESREKAKREERGKIRRSKIKANESSKPHQTEATQKAFNRMIRLLDDGLPCISCGRYKCGTYWDAGHFRTVAANPEIRFDPRACHKQGSGCNRANRRPDKNNRRNAETIAQEYESRLRERHGDEMVDWVLGPHKMPHWSCKDLMALRAVFSAECRRLERGLPPSRDWRSLEYSVKELI